MVAIYHVRPFLFNFKLNLICTKPIHYIRTNGSSIAIYEWASRLVLLGMDWIELADFLYILSYIFV